ncbi:hypothetical protein ACFV6E_20180 [Streptomyces sp. NPDC059785]|uniref:hypothetical protein n=1 Tax=Streptomyces sp. NPDC059785 TaxID=3346945 RepID=UPI00364BE920
MPIAKAEVSTPAVPTVTSKSEAMSGRRPARMNSEVPMAKTARASRYSERGIEWLRGEEKHEKVISSPRPARAQHSSHRRKRRDDRATSSVVQGADGVTESPHLV